MPNTLDEAYAALDRLQDALRATVDPNLIEELQTAYDDVAVDWFCD